MNIKYRAVNGELDDAKIVKAMCEAMKLYEDGAIVETLDLITELRNELQEYVNEH